MSLAGDGKVVRAREGRRPLRKWEVRDGYSEGLPVLYGRYLTKTLRIAVEEAVELSRPEQLSLLEELAIARDVSGRAAKQYEELLELDTPASRELLAVVRAELVAALNHVSAICERAARVDALGHDKLGVADMSELVSQIARVAHEVFQHERPDLARTFEERLSEQLRVSSGRARGTLLTPDVDTVARAMDATVPAYGMNGNGAAHG